MIRCGLIANLLVVLVFSACSRVPPPEPVAAPAQPQQPAFVDTVWRVREPTAMAPDSRYVFRHDGSLLMTSATGTPAVGRWTFENGALTMIEEGIPYQTDIVTLTADTFAIRSHHPGGTLDIVLERVDRASPPN